MKMLPHIASRVLGTPLVIGQAKLEAIISVLGPRIGIEAPFAAVALHNDAGRPRATTVTPSGIAVIPVFGTLVKRAGPIEAASGLTSCGELETEILDAATDPAVRAIVLDVDSPGGGARAALQAEVDRVYELFVETVARPFFGEGAVRAGLADGVGTMRDALAALAAAMSGSRAMISGVAATVSPGFPEVLHTQSIVKEERMTDAITETAKPGAAAPPAKNKTGSEPGPDTAAETDRKTAEVVDLDKVRAEARGEGAAEAARIADLCALAGMPERTGEMIGRGLSADEVRRELLALKAGEAGAYSLTCVAAAVNAGTFQVLTPRGYVLPDLAVGQTYAGEHINLTIADGAADFAVGDKFIVDVSGDGKVVALDPTAVDGTQHAHSIVAADVTAPDGADADGLAIVRDAILADHAILWPAGITAAQKTAALADLEARGILVRKGA